MNLIFRHDSCTADSVGIGPTETPARNDRLWLVARLLTFGFYSPMGLLVRAGVLAGLFLVAHLAGWRESTSIISGTLPDGARGLLAALKGAYYIVTYFCAVLIAPILTIAAGLLFTVGLWINRRTKASIGG